MTEIWTPEQQTELQQLRSWVDEQQNALATLRQTMNELQSRLCASGALSARINLI